MENMVSPLYLMPNGNNDWGTMPYAFYENKRVMVTGHTGFKGTWLSRWLKIIGAEVLGLGLEPPTNPAMYTLTGTGDTVHSVIADIRDRDAVVEAVNGFKPQLVFHLAAQALVRKSYLEPVETLAANVLGTAHLLDAIRGCEETQAVVIVTSDKCYANKGWTWGYRENDELGGRDPYSCSKACAELVTRAYRHSFFNGTSPGISQAALASARAGNVIGGGDFAEDRLIPDLVRAIEKGASMALRSPRAVRPWQHVIEPLGGYLLLGARLCDAPDKYAGGWNFGPNTVGGLETVGTLVKKFAASWGPGAKWCLDDRNHPHEAEILTLSSEKANHQLGWRPRVKLEQALQMTVDWYKTYMESPGELAALTDRQIRKFMESDNEI